MFYVLPGVVLLWGLLLRSRRKLRPNAVWAFGALGAAAMVGIGALGEPVLGTPGAAAVAYGAMVLVLLVARRRAGRQTERRPAGGRYAAHERRFGRTEGAAGRAAAARRAPPDISVAQARAIALANRRAIRWKENP